MERIVIIAAALAATISTAASDELVVKVGNWMQLTIRQPSPSKFRTTIKIERAATATRYMLHALCFSMESLSA
jgi:hypothetical protein